MNINQIRSVFSTIDTRQSNYFDRLKQKLEYLTNNKYPECLNQFEPLYEDEVENDKLVSQCEGFCECGKDIVNVFYIKHLKTGNTFIVGSSCIQKFRDAQQKGSFKDKTDLVLNQKIKCEMCQKKWDSNRCFYKGYCKNCREQMKNFRMPFGKYKRKKIKDINDPPYFNWLLKQNWLEQNTQLLIKNSLKYSA